MLTGTPPFSIASPRCRRFHLHATGSDIFANTCLSTSAKELLRGLLDVDDDQRWECKSVSKNILVGGISTSKDYVSLGGIITQNHFSV